MNPLIQLKTTPPLFITLALFCFGLSPRAQAVVPPLDGGYPGANTAEGQNALLSLHRRFLQYGSRLAFAPEPDHRQRQHGRWRGDARSQRGGRKYGRWRWNASN